MQLNTHFSGQSEKLAEEKIEEHDFDEEINKVLGETEEKQEIID